MTEATDEDVADAIANLDESTATISDRNPWYLGFLLALFLAPYSPPAAAYVSIGTALAVIYHRHSHA